MLNTNFEYFTRKTNRRVIYYYSPYDTLINTFLDIDNIITTKTVSILRENVKHNKSAFLVNLDSHQFIIERHRINSIGKRLKRAIKNPTKKLLENASMLLKHEIPIVEPIALIQHYSLGFPKKEFLVNKYYKGMIGCDYFSSESPMKSHWESAMNAILNLSLKLKAAKFTHDYFRSQNILMVDHKPLLVDIQNINKFNGDERAFEIEHGFDIDYFYRYLRFSPDAQKLFGEVFGLNKPNFHFSTQTPGASFL
ncbi:MAG: hypothetical protein K2X50_03455 [Gammaproteobacteria bacterium]|nr:hypothetical protein [Gammaproteobacteria bacterium]